jgi:hypothetical protein
MLDRTVKRPESALTPVDGGIFGGFAARFMPE